MKKLLLVTVIAGIFIGGFLEEIKYLAQAGHGQLSLVLHARQVEALLADPAAPEALKEKLEAAQRVRKFAISELNLRDSGSYTSYVDIARPYVTWNVIATPAHSMNPVQWCFPVVGCTSYRGYFNQHDALSFARTMQNQGYDVHVSGVPAYSTLGWLKDPLMSTFIDYGEPQMARLMFHEFAHQVLYVRDDSTFNESFAVVVEEAGVRRWVEKFGDEDSRRQYERAAQRKHDALELLKKYHRRLAENYDAPGSAESKEVEKNRILGALQEEFKLVKVKWDGHTGYDQWFDRELNNAQLASIATYYALVPAFQTLLKLQENLEGFLDAAKALAELPMAVRNEKLALLMGDGIEAQPNPNPAPVSHTSTDKT